MARKRASGVWEKESKGWREFTYRRRFCSTGPYTGAEGRQVRKRGRRDDGDTDITGLEHARLTGANGGVDTLGGAADGWEKVGKVCEVATGACEADWREQWG
jgi:hypothetical protein